MSFCRLIVVQEKNHENGYQIFSRNKIDAIKEFNRVAITVKTDVENPDVDD
jgi:hypothetical protein